MQHGAHLCMGSTLSSALTASSSRSIGLHPGEGSTFCSLFTVSNFSLTGAGKMPTPKGGCHIWFPQHAQIQNGIKQTGRYLGPFLRPKSSYLFPLSLNCKIMRPCSPVHMTLGHGTRNRSKVLSDHESRLSSYFCLQEPQGFSLANCSTSVSPYGCQCFSISVIWFCKLICCFKCFYTPNWILQGYF